MEVDLWQSGNTEYIILQSISMEEVFPFYGRICIQTQLHVISMAEGILFYGGIGTQTELQSKIYGRGYSLLWSYRHLDAATLYIYGRGPLSSMETQASGNVNHRQNFQTKERRRNKIELFKIRFFFIFFCFDVELSFDFLWH